MNSKVDDKLEKFTSTIQRKLNGKTALLIGSGGSIPYGLPSMAELANEITGKLNKKYSNEVTWQSFLVELKLTKNLETALEKITINDEIHEAIIETVWAFIDRKDKEALKNFLHSNKFPALTEILKKFLQRAGITDIITTNYDRLIEYSIDLAEGNIKTGFAGSYIKNFSYSIDSTEKQREKRIVNLFKVHGSIDWFKHKTNNKIISTGYYDPEISKVYTPLIVTPGNNKYRETHYEPFRTIIGEADKALRNSDAYLCIGYGFNDTHIQPIIIEENKSKKKPIVIVTRSITQKMQELFLQNDSDNNLIISIHNNGGSKIYYSKSETECFSEDYWNLDLFYKLWLG